jgi:branched-chain amino acid transport system substrate-binding protein
MVESRSLRGWNNSGKRSPGGRKSRRLRKSSVWLATLASATVFAALGSSGAGASSSLPSAVTFYGVSDLSGPVGVYGQYVNQGAQLAVQDINKSHYLGGTTLTVKFADAAGSTTTAASLISQAAGKYPVVLGPISSAEAVAVAPILAKANQPTVFTQAGGDGVIVGPSIVRLTAQQSSLLPLTMKYLKSKGIKTVAAIYDSDFPTLSDLATEMSNTASKYGMKYVGSSTALLADSNIAPAVSKLLQYHAGAVAVFLAGAQNSSAASLISQGGFKGSVVAEESAVTALSAAGSAANGWTWATDWNAPGVGQKSATFTKEFKAKYGKEPLLYSAEAYDAVYFAAQAMKQAGTTNASEITHEMASIGKSGFDGVLGNVKVINGQESVPGFLVQWQGGAAKIQSSS